MSGLFQYLEKNYSYYNAPEGEDPVGKIVGLGKYGFFFGGFCAIYDALLWSHCANAPQFFNTAGFWVIPMTGMCVSFSTVTYTLANLRKKDDKLNYIAGALSSGAILHAWQKNIRRSAWGTIAFLLYGTIKKQHMMEGLKRNIFLPDEDTAKYRRWGFLWRNLPYRDYTSKPWWPHNKTDYYVNHY